MSIDDKVNSNKAPVPERELVATKDEVEAAGGAQVERGGGGGDEQVALPDGELVVRVHDDVGQSLGQPVVHVGRARLASV